MELNWQPLPAAARGIFFATCLRPQAADYTTAELLICPGPLKADLLRQALGQIYSENEGLRAVFRLPSASGLTGDAGLGQKAGQPPLWATRPWKEVRQQLTLVQEIRLDLPAGAGQMPAAELAQASREKILTWAQARARASLPVLEGRGLESFLLTCGPVTAFYQGIHHLLADGFAVHELFRRLAEIYRQLEEGKKALPLQLPSLTELGAQDQADKTEAQKHLEAWKQKLADWELSQDPHPLARLESPEEAPGRARIDLEASLVESLLAWGRQEQASWPQLLLAALGSYLTRLALGSQNQEEKQEGRLLVPFMNRLLPGGPRPSARTACSAVNLLPLGLKAGGQAREEVERVKEEMLFAQTHALARQEELEAWAQDQQGQLAGCQINIVPFSTRLDLGFAGEGELLNLAAGPVPDLTLTLRGRPGQGRTISLEVDVAPDRGGQQAADRLAPSLLAWLRAWTQAAWQGTDTSDLPLVSDQELADLQTCNQTSYPLVYQPLAAQVASQAHQRPEALALLEADSYQPEASSLRGRRMTYTQLDLAARACALALQGQGVGRGQRVGLRVERGLEELVLFYGLLYAGAVYLPLSPDLPAARLEEICQDAQASLLVTGPGLEPLESQAQGASLPRQISWQSLGLDLENLGVERPADSLFPGLLLGEEEELYLLFTSGSSGRPKGVATRAGALYNRLAWQQEQLGLQAGERVLHKTPISFDVHLWELTWPLMQGACLVLADRQGHRDPAYLVRQIAVQKIDFLHFVPSMLSAFLASAAVREEALASSHRPRALILSGEALSPAQVEGVWDLYGAEVYNYYGPTEAAIDVTSLPLKPGQVLPSELPLGQPVWNTAVTVRDGAGRLLPAGVVGELHLHGEQVASGYLARPELTSFYRDPVWGASYQTGDLGCWDYEGQLRYRGRADQQVKIRGQRVELAEIESLVASHPRVSQALVLYLERGQGLLLACLESGHPVGELEADLTALLAQRLPIYMRPQSYLCREAFPVTLNGKLDRRALATWAEEELARQQPPAQAGSPAELLLVEVFSEVLGQSVALDTDFFALGGHSLAALEALALLEEKSGQRLSLPTFFANPSPRALAPYLEQPVGERGYDPLLVLQEGEPDFLGPQGLRRLILCPPAGGLAWSYLPLLAHLPAALPVYAVQAGALTGRPEGAESLAELAQSYLARLEEAGVSCQGAVLAGWSLGGMSAQALAEAAQKRGQQPLRVVLLDAYPQEAWRSLPQPGEVEIWQAFGRMAGLEVDRQLASREEVLRQVAASSSALAYLPAEVVELSLEEVRQAMALVRRGEPGFVSCPLYLLAASESLAQGREPAFWASYGQGLVWEQLEGRHVDLLSEGALGRVAAWILDPRRG